MEVRKKKDFMTHKDMYCKNEDDTDDDMYWNVIYILFLINELIAIVK